MDKIGGDPGNESTALLLRRLKSVETEHNALVTRYMQRLHQLPSETIISSTTATTTTTPDTATTNSVDHYGPINEDLLMQLESLHSRTTAELDLASLKEKSGNDGDGSNSSGHSVCPAVVYMVQQALDCLALNRSVLLFKFGRYSDVYQLLAPIFHRERIQDKKQGEGESDHVILRVCFLLLESIYQTAQQQHPNDLAQEIIAYLDKSINTSFSDLVDSSGNTSRFHHFQYRNLLRAQSPDIGQRQSSTAVHHSRSFSDTSASSSLKSTTNGDPKVSFYIYRARQSMAYRALDFALKDLDLALQIDEEQPAALLLKAYIATIRLQYREAIDHLNQCRPHIPESVFWSNMGCVHMRMGRAHLAGLYFRRALDAELMYFRERQMCHPHHAGDFKAQISFNVGVQLLCNGDSEAAFRAFQMALCEMYNYPRLWIRLAECCIMSHRYQDDFNDMADGVLPFTPRTAVNKWNGRAEQLVMPTQQLRPDTYLGNERTDIHLDDSSIGQKDHNDGQQAQQKQHPLLKSLTVFGNQFSLSLSTADLCLRNAMSLLAKVDKPNKDTLLLQNHVLMKQAYVALCSDNPVMALTCCKKILLSDSSNSMKITALCYAAEALCVMNRGNELFFLLSTDEMQRLLTSQDQSSSGKDSSTSTDTSKCIRDSLYVNIAIVHILQQQYQRAQEIIDQQLNASNDAQVSSHVRLLQIYLHLVQGRERECIAYVQSHRPLPIRP